LKRRSVSSVNDADDRSCDAVVVVGARCAEGTEAEWS